MTTTVMNFRQNELETEAVEEYFREIQLPSRESSVLMSTKLFGDRHMQEEQHVELEAPKSDELEALWPGVHHDFVQPVHRAPSFYLTVGFMAGALISLVGVALYVPVSHVVFTANSETKEKQILVAGASQKATSAGASAGSPEVLVPAAPTYQVQAGDTLAAIALKNYKRVSPRLLDEICRTNNMRNANVLSLGQNLTLPAYHAQASQIAQSGLSQIQ